MAKIVATLSTESSVPSVYFRGLGRLIKFTPGQSIDLEQGDYDALMKGSFGELAKQGLITVTDENGKPLEARKTETATQAKTNPTTSK